MTDPSKLTTNTLLFKLRRSDDPVQVAAADRLEKTRKALVSVSASLVALQREAAECPNCRDLVQR